MGKESIRLRKVVLLSGALCAYWIGSGFATGQEVLQFFSVSGIKGIIAALIFLALTSYFTYSFFVLGYKKKFDNPYNVFEYYCGKILGQIYTWLSVLVIYITFVVMLAGGGATINQYFGVPPQVGIGVIAILALGTALLGVNKLISIIGVLGPIKIIFITIIGITGVVSVFRQPALFTQASRLMPNLGFHAASSNWAWSGALYAFLVLTISVPFQITCGDSAKNVKEAKTAALLATIAYTSVIILLVIAEVIYYKLIIGRQVPLLAIASYISPALGLIFSVIIVVCIYSAASSSLLMTVRKFAADKTRKFNIIAIILTAFGILFGGELPFDKMVNILYPLEGYSFILLAAFIICKQLKENIINSCVKKKIK